MVVAAVKVQHEPERREDSALEGLSEAQCCHNCICVQEKLHCKTHHILKQRRAQNAEHKTDAGRMRNLGFHYCHTAQCKPHSQIV